SVVEAATPGAGSVHEEAVEYGAARLVGVEALVDEMSQEPARLRDAEANTPANGEGAGRVVFAVRHHVPHRGEAEADDDRVSRAIDQLVDPAGLEAPGVSDPRPTVHEAPLIARHDAAGRQPALRSTPRARSRAARPFHRGWRPRGARPRAHAASLSGARP